MVAYNIHKSGVIVRSSAGGPFVSVLTVGRKACLMDRPRIDCITDNDPQGNGLKAWDINRKSSMSASVAKGISMNNLFFCVCTTTHTHACTHTEKQILYMLQRPFAYGLCREIADKRLCCQHRHPIFRLYCESVKGETGPEEHTQEECVTKEMKPA